MYIVLIVLRLTKERTASVGTAAYDSIGSCTSACQNSSIRCFRLLYICRLPISSFFLRKKKDIRHQEIQQLVSHPAHYVHTLWHQHKQCIFCWPPLAYLQTGAKLPSNFSYLTPSLPLKLLPIFLSYSTFPHNTKPSTSTPTWLPAQRYFETTVSIDQ
jgi:hypothetical protein